MAATLKSFTNLFQEVSLSYLLAALSTVLVARVHYGNFRLKSISFHTDTLPLRNRTCLSL